MVRYRLNPTFVGEIPEDHWHGQLVVAFGRVRIDAAIPEDRVWRVENPAGDGIRGFADRLRPELLVDGIFFVVPESLEPEDACAVFDIQRLLIHLHYKYVYFPQRSLSTADVAGVREESLPDVIREINQLRNYPWLLSSPLTDKLAREKIGLPLLVVLPGPSMHEVLPRLEAMRDHCLVACVGRTVNDCLHAGVIPDVVIQLDTYQVQRNFYENLPDMPETLLVPLSICPFYPYARKFRGVVMMDSFNLELLPNPARLRESYVSTITACLGLAEALHAPHCFIAGADLSAPLALAGHPYEGRTSGPLPVFSHRNTYLFQRRDGSLAQGWDYFIATAQEVDQFAEAIGQNTGTRFYSTTDATLLSRRWFPHGPPETILGLPQVDRAVFLAAVDRVLAVREDVDITRTRMHLLRLLEEVRGAETAYVGGGVPREVLENHTLTKAVGRMRNPMLKGDVDRVGVAARVASKWREALNDARLLIQAVTQAGRGRAVPLLCLPHEVEPLKMMLGRIVGGGRWELFTISTPPCPPFPEAETLAVNDVLGWLAGQQAVFASPGIMKEFEYIMDYAPGGNVYDLRRVAGPEIKRETV
ncbi:DUF115 domain-containing protein [Pseudodesulfovibrio cashew]|uniref:DUF115 domain-containing protein n=1 Tax=Pseudodesulfovibrio cashew TaxID=2678688 RepID=A0A6I6JEH5_9BACT|nr:6-hydroxymethylpterin diphosphokinase MptE-like protein [Pseudodesulfovibrio cashew]QGY39569.1 DUF115 domain-containing protein [Pseudodesulfovibrio cashew]